ncbi:MAG TPA: serine/threonine-protein kinase [Vicinamibacteria bacterium]|nr:serine/threonine-protein kinase [Vicinamibacteria bacterium]
MDCPSCGAANEPAAEVCFSCRTVLSAVSRGTVLAARYEIRDIVGRGGMGTVYRARDLVLDEEVAIKVLRADVAQAPGMADRFLSEIKLARRVSHPNVCRIHEYGEAGALRFISMELVKGKSLKDVLAAGPLPAERAFDVAEQAARGLVAIHGVGIVHRDLKPANLTLDETGRVRVMDFGIAKSAGKAGDTTAGYLLGSPEYMSPEQARGRGADFSSDIYSLGVVVFELFAGRPPFRADTPVGTLLLHIEAPPPLGAGEGRIPPPLVGVLRRALAKEPAHRQSSAFELAEDLRHAAEVALGPARVLEAAAASPPSGRGLRRRWALAAALVLAVFGGAWMSWFSSPPVSPSVAPPLPSPAPPTPGPTVAPSSSPGSASPSPTSRPAPDRRPLPAAPSPGPPPSRPSEPASPEGVAPSTATTTDERVRSLPAPSEPSGGARAPSVNEAAPAPGFLLVVVSPWADVTIDGQSAGQTPLVRIPLPPGPHTVRLTHPAFHPYPRRVTVRSGETTRLTVDLAQDGVRLAR